MTQPVIPTTVAFSQDQRFSTTVEFWDTPFTTLEGDRASRGIPMDVKEPTGASWTLASTLQNTSVAAAASAWASTSGQRFVVQDGRVANLIDYWAGGAPGWHGASQRGRVAYKFRLYMRHAAGRAWFGGGAPQVVTLALGGNGYFRVDYNGTQNLFDGTLSERTFLYGGSDGKGGLQILPPVAMASGEYLDVYYVQGRENEWGGYVVKALPMSFAQSYTERQRQKLVREAIVVGCGLFDDNYDNAGSLPKRTLQTVREVSVERRRNEAATATFELPLINPQRFDGEGWEWTRANGDDPGYLRLWRGGVNQFDLRRGRLVRVKMNLDSETWTTFTGIVEGFDGASDGTVAVTCKSFEQRLLTRYDKNYPDKIDYMARNYRRRLGATEPVYELPAFDNWPVEHAITALCYRAGIDGSRLTRPLTVPLSNGSSRTVSINGDNFTKLRARTLTGKFVRLERPVHYGNFGAAFTESQRPDDEYVFKPESTRELWSRIRQFVDRYGFSCAFDETGDLCVAGVNNAHYAYNVEVTDITGGVPVEKTNPNAFGGTYIEVTSPGPEAFTKRVTGARIDLVMGRYVGSKNWSYTVTRVSDGFMFTSGIVNPSLSAGTADQFFYDFRSTADGSNACVATLFSGDFDTYDIALNGNGGGTGQRTDAVLVYHTDPLKSRLPQTLATTRNALSVKAQDLSAEHRNYVTVVGRRTATVTDSTKLDENPNNPESEFVVEVAVDASSVTDPTSPTYTGVPRESFIYDKGITDEDFAAYLARAFIYRYRNPKPGAMIEHTLLPFVQLYDPVLVLEDRYRTVTTDWTLWVNSIRHAVSQDRALTTLECSSFPDYPAYEPRTDIDIDKTFYGKPVANVQLSYTGVHGSTLNNLTDSAITLSIDAPSTAGGDIVDVTGVSVTTSGGKDYLVLPATSPWPPVPGTVFIQPYNPPSSAGTAQSTSILSNVMLPSGGQAAAQTPLVNLQSITSVTATVTSSIGLESDPVWNQESVTLTQNPKDSGYRLYYELVGSPQNPTVTIRREAYDEPYYIDSGSTFSGPARAVTVSATVNWRQGKQFSGAQWMTNTPYGRFFTTDYRSNGQNYCAWSEDFSKTGTGAWALTSLTVVNDQKTAPDGSLTADRLVDTSGATVRHATQASLVPASSTGTFRIGVWVKRDTYRFAWLQTEVKITAGGSVTKVSWFDLDAAGTVTTNGHGSGKVGAEVWPDGWFYLWAQDATSAGQTIDGGTPFRVGFSTATNDGTSSGGTGGGLYVWGAQLSLGATKKPYVRTSTAAVADAGGRTLTLTWDQGGEATEYSRNTSVTQYSVRYRRMCATDGLGNPVDPYSGASPFYDPYLSEQGQLVQLTFDALVTGLYRISVRSAVDDTIVAWLTEPTVDDANEEAHWTYFSAGATKRLFWDGVDNLGDWNKRQSEDYALTAQGAFEQDQKPTIGRGFYVWNRERDGGNLGPLAVIATDRDPTTGKPLWGAGAQGTYAAWYVMIEATNDDLVEAAEDLLEAPVGQALVNDDRKVPRVVKSNSMDSRVNTSVVGSASQALIFTHLPEPTKATIEVKDWVGSAVYDPDDDVAINTESNWGTADTDATINNYKPVRIRFNVETRPGPLWTARRMEDLSLRLFRVAHLKYLLFDQGTQFKGAAWPDITAEEKAVFNRRLAGDSHTIRFEDSAWRKAKTLKDAYRPDGTEWIFRPDDMKKNWRGVENESLKFMDYLQLEEVPGWDPVRQVGAKRSRLHIAFLGYLLYLSAYTSDRSGRMVWCIDKTFKDQAKIPKMHAPANSYSNGQDWGFTLDWPEDPVRMHRRSIITRQWTDERVNPWTTWVEYERQRWSMGSGSFAHKLLKHYWKDHDPATRTFAGATWPQLGDDDYSKFHFDAGHLNSVSFYASDSYTTVSGPLRRQLRDGDLGTWTFETGPTWYPCITRDFYPYFLVPPMVDPGFNQSSNSTSGAYYQSVDGRNYHSSDNTLNDPAAGDVWSSGANDMTEANAANRRFWVGTTIQKNQPPVNGGPIAANSINYVRQDDMQHYEDFRGAFSRGPRPAEQPKKVTPILPYYVNALAYADMSFRAAYHNPSYGHWYANIGNVFSLKFRTQYVWESASMFPVDDLGLPANAYYNHHKCRFFSGAVQLAGIRYDAGAWVGWKDDLPGTPGTDSFLISGTNTAGVAIWDTGRFPIGVGPVTPYTREMYMHLALINERRAVPLIPAAVGVGANTTSSVTITSSSTTLSLADASGNTFTATPRNSSGNELSDRVVTWVIDSSAIATVSVTGSRTCRLTPVTAGSTTLRARIDGVEGTATITVVGAVATVSLDQSSVVTHRGASFQLTVSPRDGGGTLLTGRTPTWWTDAPGIFNIAQTAGSYTVSVSVEPPAVDRAGNPIDRNESVSAKIGVSVDGKVALCDVIIGTGVPQLKVVDSLEAWFKADAGPITVSTSNLLVTDWLDRSPKLRHLSQATTAQQPSRVAGQLNGGPVVRFDGSRRFGTLAMPVPLQKLTVFYVLKYTNNGVRKVVYTNGGARPYFAIDTSNKIEVDAAGSGAVSSLAYTGYITVCIIHREGAQTTLRVNGALISTSSSTHIVPVGVSFMTFNNSTADGFNGDVAESMMYSRELSAAEIDEVERYLQRRWATF